jgi:hypothetical protein
LRSFGSVRGEGSDALAYSENRPGAAFRPKAACRRAAKRKFSG